jgi:hypothetical protein
MPLGRIDARTALVPAGVTSGHENARRSPAAARRVPDMATRGGNVVAILAPATPSLVSRTNAERRARVTRFAAGELRQEAGTRAQLSPR